VIRQIFVARMGVKHDVDTSSHFEVMLFVIRKRIEAALRKIQGGSDPVYPTDTPRLDITDANNGDRPPV
jgi:hypothetical protein